MIIAVFFFSCQVDWSQEEIHLMQTLTIRVPQLDPSNHYESDPLAAELGRSLFFDQRLSAKGDKSCASCHIPSQYFTDKLDHPVGFKRNTPTLINAAFQSFFFWDGRRDSLWSQALDPVQHPLEFDSSIEELANLVRSDDCLSQRYLTIFGESPTSFKLPDSQTIAVHIAKSIAAYEFRLISAPSPFDHFAKTLQQGQTTSHYLDSVAQKGLKLFIGQAGCIRCHHGPSFSDGQFHRLGIPDQIEPPTLSDSGRWQGMLDWQAHHLNAASEFSDDTTSYRARRVKLMQVSDRDWASFRTPSLRNVAMTAPYMHNGSFPTLESVLEMYNLRTNIVAHGHHPEPLLTPLELGADELNQLILFLHTLTSPIADSWLEPPPLCD